MKKCLPILKNKQCLEIRSYTNNNLTKSDISKNLKRKKRLIKTIKTIPTNAINNYIKNRQMDYKTTKNLESLLRNIEKRILKAFDHSEIKSLPTEREYQLITCITTNNKDDELISKIFNTRNDLIITQYKEKKIITTKKEEYLLREKLKKETDLIVILYKKETNLTLQGTITFSLSQLGKLKIPSANYRITQKEKSLPSNIKYIGDLINKYISQRKKENPSLQLKGICEVCRLALKTEKVQGYNRVSNLINSLNKIKAATKILQAIYCVIENLLEDYFIIVGCNDTHAKLYKRSGLKHIFRGYVEGIRTPYNLLIGHNPQDYKTSKILQLHKREIPLYFINSKNEKIYLLKNYEEHSLVRIAYHKYKKTYK